MVLEYSFTYLRCQSCTARVHCAQCGAELEADLERHACVRRARADMEGKRLSIDIDDAACADAEDILEDAGVFV